MECLSGLDRAIVSELLPVVEVIVTADGNMPNIPAERGYPITVVAGPNRGPAANRNHGVRCSNGEWLIFLDDDCIPSAGYLRAYRDAIERNASCAVFEGRVTKSRSKQSLSDTAPLNEHGGFLWSCNFAIRRDLFNKLGGFNEEFRFPCMEDVELRKRILKSGREFEFVSAASVVHPWRNLPDWSYYENHFASTLIYLSLHPDEKKNINARYYLRMALSGFVKQTIPGIVRFRGRGLVGVLRQHVAFLWAAARLGYGG